MRRFGRSAKDAIREAKAGNEFMRRMYSPDAAPLDYSAHNLDRKRAVRVRDAMVPSEHQSQAAVISWWRISCKHYQLPEFALFAVPNGGARDPIAGARLKAEGVRPGIPDLMLAAKRGTCSGLLLEMKKIGNRASPEQRVVIDYLFSAGYDCCIAYSADSAIAAIKEYLAR